jgi:hypothetical protein
MSPLRRDLRHNEAGKEPDERAQSVAPRSYARILMSFVYRNGWYVEFFNLDRMRTKLPRSAFFSSDEALVEFIHRCRGAKTLEDKNILEMQMKHNFGEVTLELTDQQHAKLRQRASKK